ncbi:hypothetical protein [Methanobrevibacter sp.]|uniref:hypothetical protein n=1 Tax=Methanobrevibacter sp. TaxID=66852 RepID=UPI00388F159C
MQYYNCQKAERRKNQMKTTQQILEKIITDFVYNLKESKRYVKQASEDLKNNHYNSYQENMTMCDLMNSKNCELAQMYAFIKEIKIMVAFNELEKIASEEWGEF